MAGKGRIENLIPWPKGKSGNPGGRPRKKPVTERYEELMTTPLPDEVRRKLKLEEGATYGDALAYRIFMAAITGKHEAAKEITDRVEGRAPQSMQISGPNGKPLIPKGGLTSRPMKQFTEAELAAAIKMAVKDAAKEEQETRSGDAKPG